MRHLLDADPFSSDLMDDMHEAFDVACAEFRLAPKSDRATEFVAFKVKELARAGRSGNDLTAATLRFFIEPRDAAEKRRTGG